MGRDSRTQTTFKLLPTRAIENRRDIVKGANTGISAIISARGEIIKKQNTIQKLS